MKKMKPAFLLLGLVLICNSSMMNAQIFKPEYTRFKLENGLPVILHRDTTTASISVNMAYHAGSSRDPKGKSGLANICGTIATLGSKRVSYRDMLKLQYFAAAKVSGRTTADLMSVSSTFPSAYLDAALWVEADRMTAAAVPITDDIIHSITRNLLAQRRKTLKEPLSDIDSRIYQEIYPAGHPYKIISLGDTNDVAKIRASDVKKFMDRYYVPSNACLTIAGNFDIDEAKDLVRKHFADIPAGNAAEWKTLPPLPPLGTASLVKEDNVSNSRLYVIIPTVSRSNPDAPGLDLLAKYLAGSVNAFLEERLVKKNPYILAVEASQSSRELDGNFWIIINCKFEAAMKDIFADLRKELDGLADAPLSEPDLDEARNYDKMLYSMVMENVFGMGGRAETINCDALLEGTPMFLPNTLEAQLRLSIKDLQRLLKKYFTFENVFTLSIVPRGQKSRGVVFE